AEYLKNNTYRKRIEREMHNILTNYPDIPLHKTDGKPVKYALGKDFTLPVSEVDITLAMLLHFSRNSFSNVLPDMQKQQLNNYYAKAEALFKNEKSAKPYDRFITSIASHPEGYGNRLINKAEKLVTAPVISSIAEALFRQKKIKIEYERRYKEDTTTMTVSPLGIVLRGHVMYLVISFHGRESLELRHLHCGRIFAIQLLDDKSVTPEEFNLDEYIKGGAFQIDGYRDISEQEITLRIQPHLKTLFLERIDTPKFTDNDDGLLVHFSEKPYAEFRWWLLGFGSQLEVIEPANLRDDLKGEISQMHNLYCN
ncbi:MAG: WYL domain-containing protein, partial [Colwellia sp.]